jgi:hypothetical protein
MAKVGALTGKNGEIADYAFRHGRKWYKEADKSNNKKYDYGPDESQWPAEMADKIRRRNAGVADHTETRLDDLRDSLPHNPYDSRFRGKQLRNEGIKYGNCGEMCCVAMSYAAEAPGYDADATPLWQVILAPPSQHFFVMVGPALPNAKTLGLRDLAQATPGGDADANGRYIVDVWGGICCHASEYPSLFELQMNEWSENRKRVSVGGNWVDPAAEYLTATLAARMHFLLNTN